MGKRDKSAAHGATLGATLSGDKPPILAVIDEQTKDETVNKKAVKVT